MTFGALIDKAHEQLTATATALTSSRRPIGVTEIASLIAPRQDVYRGLARLLTLLNGGQPARVDRPTHLNRAIARANHGRAGLYLGLHTATALVAPYLRPPGPAPAPAWSLRRAADMIEAAGDVLATHVQPRRRPRTPEGEAIRAGGGGAAALADVARLTHDVLGVDANVLGWIARADNRLAPSLTPITEALRWARTSTLGAVADSLIESAAAEPRLLYQLRPASIPAHAGAAVTTPSEAVDTFRAVRDWLWYDPAQVHAVHLRTATQLGVAVSAANAADTHEEQVRIRAWRRASVAASQVQGSPPHGPPADAADNLHEVLKWARERLMEPAASGSDDCGPALRRLAGELPIFADVLHRAVPLAVRRNDLFVSSIDLQKPPGAVIYYATANWRLATMDDGPVGTMWRAFGEIKATRRAMQPLAVLSRQATTARLSFAASAESPSIQETDVVDRRNTPARSTPKQAR